MSVTGTMATTIGTQNPFRYRGYYYDFESGFYYLNSRYYDPDVGRFLNADDISVLGESPMDVTDKNVFAYCDNNPISRADYSGELWETVLDIAGIFWSAYDLIRKPSLANAGYLAWDLGATLIPFVPGSYTAKGAKLGIKMFSKADDVGRVGKASSKIKSAAKSSNRIFNVSKQESKVFKKFKSVKGSKYKYSGSGRNKKYYDWDNLHNDIEVYDRNGKHVGSMDPKTGKIYKSAERGRKINVN